MANISFPQNTLKNNNGMKEKVNVRVRKMKKSLMFVMIIVAIAAIAAMTTTTAHALRMIGQQFFPNGTGTAYFDDGTTEQFEHAFTPEQGYYYDNTTTFINGAPPGFEGNQTIIDINSRPDGYGSTGDIINVTIANGAELLGDRAIQPSNIIHAKAGDVIVLWNEDWQVHNLQSPPQDYTTPTPAGGNWGGIINPGEYVSLILTKPGAGYHFADTYNSEIKGAVIIEERERK
jgi:hypothetical protein